MTMGCRPTVFTPSPTALKPLGSVTVVAPTQEASAIGHALTLRRPLRIEDHGPGLFAVDGTPTDCVNLGVDIILKQKPDLVVSGINKGWNLGDDVTYSGTVAGALEGALLGIPSIAVSLKRTGSFDFSFSAEAAATVARGVLASAVAVAHVPEPESELGPLQGLPRDHPGHGAITSPRSPPGPTRAGRPTTGSRRPSTSGTPTAAGRTTRR